MNTMSLRIAIASLLLFTATTASACGHCVEDRIAAVYDHTLVKRTVVGKFQIVYFAWDGPLPRDEATRKRILALGEAVTGVATGSVRVAMEPAAIAVAFDPRRSSAAAIAAALQKKLQPLKVGIVPLLARAAGAS